MPNAGLLPTGPYLLGFSVPVASPLLEARRHNPDALSLVSAKAASKVTPFDVQPVRFRPDAELSAFPEGL